MTDSNSDLLTPKVRPTKKQRELLVFIESFIASHGYSPSYREIMQSLDYTSVATVAVHINNLIKRGHLRKRENAARSLEVVAATPTDKLPSTEIQESEEKWLIEKVQYYFAQVESGVVLQKDLDQLYVLVGALKVLGLEGAAHSFFPRLNDLAKKVQNI